MKKIIHSTYAVYFAFLPSNAFAKKVIDYIPPPYWMRYLISVLTILPIAIIFGSISYFAIKLIEKEIPVKKRNYFSCFVLVVALISCAFSANDSLNDEMWNPYFMGANFLSLIIPFVAVYLLTKIKLWARLLLSIMLLIPAWWIVAFATMGWQFFGIIIGLPTSW
ncbi:hypothetical protein [Desulforegula conservatrix]|uniref:hypothetical protein n=1 Tax=Desulforegula conservatrix TaxID=153026 RepID=UPI00047F3F6D|nr:hypothetical protein [Desulforegula conservatrix]